MLSKWSQTPDGTLFCPECGSFCDKNRVPPDDDHRPECSQKQIALEKMKSISMTDVLNSPEIKNIDIAWSKNTYDMTVITVARNDGTEFLLFVSNEGKKDRLFVDRLNHHWKKQQNKLLETDSISEITR